MLIELAVATLMVLATVIFHGVGLVGLGRGLGVQRVEYFEFGPLSTRGLGLTLAVVIGLFVLHGIEIWAYAVLFHLLGAVPDLRDAVYFSTITYGAIGYGDGPIADEWKLLAGIEGINGVLLIGWSVAFFVTVMDRLSPRPAMKKPPP